jgi:hypothetical protein
VLGVVLNDVQTEVAGYQYAHHYTHYYGEESTAPAPPSRLGRLWQALRARADRPRGGTRTRPASGRPREAIGVSRARARSGGYRNMTLGLVVVAGLAAALGGALAWRTLRPAPTLPHPRAALRERLDAPPALPVAAVSAFPATPPAIESKARPPANGSAAGYALELGPFASAKEAEDVEQRVNDAGYATVRARHAPGASAYVVLIDRIATPKDGEALVRTLREQGFGEALIVEDGGASAVRVGGPRPLRDAVGVAGRLRALGHPVRVASQPGDAEHFVVRHGTYPNRHAAGEKGEALKRLGFTPQIVRVR